MCFKVKTRFHQPDGWRKFDIKCHLQKKANIVTVYLKITNINKSKIRNLKAMINHLKVIKQL